MDISFTNCSGEMGGPPLWQFLWPVPFLGALFLLWLLQGSRDSRDVLHATPAPPVSDSLRLASFAEWAVPAGVLLLLLMAGMWQLYGLLFLDLAGWMGLPDGSVALAGPHAELLPREAVLVGLRLGACWVLWQLLRRPERDALRVNTP